MNRPIEQREECTESSMGRLALQVVLAKRKYLSTAEGQASFKHDGNKALGRVADGYVRPEDKHKLSTYTSTHLKGFKDALADGGDVRKCYDSLNVRAPRRTSPPG